MKRSLRYLRIAFSATCLIACVLLIVLWVRSYWCVEYIRAGAPPSCIEIKSADGKLHFYRFAGEGKAFFSLESLSYTEGDHAFASNTWDSFDSWYIVVPDWFATFAVIVFATVPWLPGRFSLRTLLIATTQVAVVLGIIVWISRAG